TAMATLAGSAANAIVEAMSGGGVAQAEVVDVRVATMMPTTSTVTPAKNHLTWCLRSESERRYRSASDTSARTIIPVQRKTPPTPIGPKMPETAGTPIGLANRRWPSVIM